MLRLQQINTQLGTIVHLVIWSNHLPFTSDYPFTCSIAIHQGFGGLSQAKLKPQATTVPSPACSPRHRSSKVFSNTCIFGSCSDLLWDITDTYSRYIYIYTYGYRLISPRSIGRFKGGYMWLYNLSINQPTSRERLLTLLWLRYLRGLDHFQKTPRLINLQASGDQACPGNTTWKLLRLQFQTPIRSGQREKHLEISEN